jgi:PmbA protein
MPDYENFDADIMVDKSFDDCSVETLSEMAKELTGSAMNADGRIKSVKQASVSASKSVTDIITSFGASLRRERTYFSATAYVIANDGDDESDAYEHQVKTSLAELDINELGIEAGRKACELLDAKRVKTDKYHILFSSDVMADFIELLLELTDGDNVYKKRSMLAGKLEQKIASSCFTLTDDPSLKNAAGSYTFDDEGQKASKTEIIKDGILKSFLHNSYTSKALGMGNSANASLGSGGNMSIDSSNVILESTTDKSIDEVCSEYLRVTEVMGMHTADPISGDFSVGISGVYFKDGKAVYPFREAVLSGNLKDLLNGITHVFSNKKTFGSITTADALFDKMTVSGE